MTIFLWLATGLYLLQTVMFLYYDNWPQALMMGAYALANIGIIWSVP